jgi:hypothetical protein
MVNMSADDQSPISSFHGAEMLIFYKLKDRRVERIDIASIDRGAFVDLLARTPNFLVGTESVPGFRDLGIDVSEEALYRVFSSHGDVRRQFLRHGRDTLSLARLGRRSRSPANGNPKRLDAVNGSNMLFKPRPRALKSRHDRSSGWAVRAGGFRRAPRR